MHRIRGFNPPSCLGVVGELCFVIGGILDPIDLSEGVVVGGGGADAGIGLGDSALDFVVTEGGLDASG